VVADPEDDAIVYTEAASPVSTCPVTVLSNGSLVYAASRGAANFEVQAACSVSVVACEASTAELLCAAVSVSVSVSIEDVNEAPVLSPASLLVFVPENSTLGAIVGRVVAADVDGGDTLVFSFAPTTLPLPDVSPSVPLVVLPNGSIAVTAAGGSLDAESWPLIQMSVLVTDARGLTDSGLLRVSVLQSSDAPVVVCGDGAASAMGSVPSWFTEHATGVVAELPVSVADADSADILRAVVLERSELAGPLSVSLIREAPVGHTQLHSLHLSAGAYVEPGAHWLVVAVKDSSEVPSARACNITIQVVNVNDPPRVASSASLAELVFEGAAPGFVVATLPLEDADVGQPLSCSVSSVFHGIAGVRPDVPVFSAAVGPAAADRLCRVVLSAQLLDAEVCPFYLVTIIVSDGALHATVNLTVIVGDEMDPPLLTSVSAPGARQAVLQEGAVSVNRPLDTAGGDVLVVRGVNVGAPTPGGFANAAAVMGLGDAPSVWLWYWDASAVAPVVLNSTSCVVVVGGSGLPGEVHCVTVPGAGPVSAARLVVYGQSSPIFAVDVPIVHEAPSVSAISPSLLSTAGGEAVTLFGTGFGPEGSSWLQSVTVGAVALAGCVVSQADTQLACMSVPVDASLGQLPVAVLVAGAESPAPIVRYRSPCLRSVAVDTPSGQGLSQGGDTVWLHGGSLGLAGSPVDLVAYGARVTLAQESAADASPLLPTWALFPAASGAEVAEPLYFARDCVVVANHTVVRCTTAPGVGAGHVWVLVQAGRVSALCEGASLANVTSGYGPPTVSALAVVPSLDSPLGGAHTEGGSVVRVSGTNFGAAGTMASVLVGASAGLVVAPLLVDNDTAAWFVAPPGAGSSHPVIVTVGGQASSSSVATFAYAAPTVLTVQLQAGTCVLAVIVRVWEGSRDQSVTVRVRACITVGIGGRERGWGEEVDVSLELRRC
jgi:hypothetical protein